MKTLILASLFIILTSTSFAQKVQIKILDEETKEFLVGVTVKENAKPIAMSNVNGMVLLELNNGVHQLEFSCIGYDSKTSEIRVPANEIIEINLSPSKTQIDEVEVVASTRNNQKIENSPLKVEVLGKEEMDEENTIKPGNISSILGDISGIQIQQSSAVSGNSNVRIQGLEGRYTQILHDGMPLYDGFSGDFGILSIPPLDLKQIELIKGSASTLYGGGAIGGLVNIISKTPSEKQEGIVTLNQTTLKESNINAYFSNKYKKFGYTFFGGTTNQFASDVNKDGISDIGNLQNLVLHPRLFVYLDDKTTITAGYALTIENRKGGDMQVLNGNSDAIHQYFEENKTARHSGELLFSRTFESHIRLDFKNSVSSFDHAITTNTHYFKGNQTDYFSELSLLVPYGFHSFVGGLNFTGNNFKKLPSDDVPLQNFKNNIVGFFAQNTWNVNDNALIEAGLRDDYHFKYGNFVLPRLAVFYRFDKHWASRAGVGMGYKTPNPLAPQIFDVEIQQIQPISSNVKAEKSIGYNLEANYKTTWNNGNTFFVNHAFFLTNVSSPIVAVQEYNGNVSFSNQNKPVISKGFDTYVKAVVSEWELYAGYTFTMVERKYLSENQFMPLTPKHRAAFTLVKDFDEIGFRFGLEGSYTGSQYRFDYSKTRGYFFLASMIEKRFGKHISVVLNGENLLNFRQSNVEPLYSGSITNPTFTPLWAPIDGRVLNLSLKWQL